MLPTIVEDYQPNGIDVGSIVRRILSHLSPDLLDGLHEVRLLDQHDKAFACYKRNDGIIEIYVTELLGGFSPIWLKMLYPITYTLIGMALGHELDHHVNRDNQQIDKEKSAESHVWKYIYPSLGVFKPAMWVFASLFRAMPRSWQQRIGNMEKA